jgi:hypothetical protein
MLPDDVLYEDGEQAGKPAQLLPPHVTPALDPTSDPAGHD